MSASLVGSEMCIRDRSLAPPPLPTPWILCRRTTGKALPVGAPLETMRPVSYTHLTLPTICSV
eukprot:11293227-Alexandrium_andersonii.AAC.1